MPLRFHLTVQWQWCYPPPASCPSTVHHFRLSASSDSLPLLSPSPERDSFPRLSTCHLFSQASWKFHCCTLVPEIAFVSSDFLLSNRLSLSPSLSLYRFFYSHEFTGRFPLRFVQYLHVAPRFGHGCVPLQREQSISRGTLSRKSKSCVFRR